MAEEEKEFWEVINRAVAYDSIATGEASRLLSYAAICKQYEVEKRSDFYDSYLERYTVPRMLGDIDCNDLSKIASHLNDYMERNVLKGDSPFSPARLDEQCRCVCFAYKFIEYFFRYTDSEDKNVKIYRQLFE